MTPRLVPAFVVVLAFAPGCEEAFGFTCQTTADCVEQGTSCPSGQMLFCNTSAGLGVCDCRVDPAAGTALLDQPRNDDWDYFSDASCDPAQAGCPNVVAENFLVPSEGASITEIVVWGGWWPNGIRTSDDWTVIFHADAAGLPGGAVYTQSNFTATRIDDIGEIFGVDYYEIELELTGDVDLSPGTHWIEIFHDSGAGDFWFWVTGDMDPVAGLPGFAEAPEAPGVSWALHDVNSEPPLRRSLAIRMVE